MSREERYRSLLTQALDYISCVSRQCGGEDGCVCGGEDLNEEIRQAVSCVDGENCAWVNELKMSCTCEPRTPGGKFAPSATNIHDYKIVTKDEL